MDGIKLTAEHHARLTTASADGIPVVVATVDSANRPHLAYYGSVQVFDEDHLALLAHTRTTSIFERIAANPHVALMYGNRGEKTFWQFEGEARVDDDPEVRRVVWENSPEVDRRLDADHHGRAILIRVDRIEARNSGNVTVYARSTVIR